MTLEMLAKRLGTSYDGLMSFYGMDFALNGHLHETRPLGHYASSDELPPALVAAMIQLWMDAPDIAFEGWTQF